MSMMYRAKHHILGQILSGDISLKSIFVWLLIDGIVFACICRFKKAGNCTEVVVADYTDKFRVLI
jgi:uncharacterized membrane protein